MDKIGRYLDVLYNARAIEIKKKILIPPNLYK